MRKQIFQRLAGVVAVGLVFASTAQVAQASHAWGNYHWARTTPQFTLQLGNNLTTANWQGHLSTTSNDWNNGGNSPVQTAIVAGKTTARRCAMVAGTTQVCNETYGANGWLGLASINISGSHITQGTAKLNDTYFNTSTYNNPNERLHVMCQEVAHTFGLGHTSEDGSSQNTCMDYFSNTGANAGSTISTKPNQHDFDMLNQIYAHLDSTNTYAALGSGSMATKRSEVDIDHDNPSTWGELKSQSENGRSSTYERNNKDGSITVTHVTWTVEAAADCPSCDHRRDIGEQQH